MAKIKKFKLDTESVKADVAKIGAGARKERETATDSMMSEMSKRKAAPAKPAAKQSFSAAFAAARKDPEAMKRGTFTYNGKSFTTKLASEKKAAPKPAAEAQAPAAKAKDYVPKGGTKMGAPSTAKAPAGSMLTKTPPKNSSAYTGPVKTGSEARASFAGAKPAGFTGFTSTPKAAPKPKPKPKAVEGLSAKDKPSVSMLTKTPPKNSSDYKGLARKAKGGAVDGIAKRGKTRARSK